MIEPEFERYSASYDELLQDPIRDRFTGNCPAFFHLRKRDLIRDYCRRRDLNTHRLSYLDLGCGKGELVTLLRPDFGHVAGCDLSPKMMESVRGIETRVQEDPGKIPFDSETFDFVTAVCVYHHVAPGSRAELTAEIRRVLKPDGVLAIIDHNPFNPVTRLIVGRAPVDSGAILLTPSAVRRLLRGAGFNVHEQSSFLYFPACLYRRCGSLERLLAKIPLGGQFAVFGGVGK